ncbi:unnamed protein product [Closterium sp. NIES-53]
MWLHGQGSVHHSLSFDLFSFPCTDTGGTGTGSGAFRRITYFPNWSGIDPSTFQVNHFTHIVYAFAAISPVNYTVSPHALNCTVHPRALNCTVKARALNYTVNPHTVFPTLSPYALSLTLSPSCSLSHAHSLTLSPSCSLPHALSLMLSPLMLSPLMLSPSCSFPHALSLMLSPSGSLPHALSLMLSPSCSLPRALSLMLSPSCSLPHALSLMLSLSCSLPHALSLALPPSCSVSHILPRPCQSLHCSHEDQKPSVNARSPFLSPYLFLPLLPSRWCPLSGGQTSLAASTLASPQPSRPKTPRSSRFSPSVVVMLSAHRDSLMFQLLKHGALSLLTLRLL